MYVLGFHINMIEQTLTELSYRTVFVVGAEWEILVCVEHHYILERQSVVLVAAHEFFIDGSERQTGAESHYIFASGFLCTLYFCLYGVGDNCRTLLHFGIDVGEDFLATCDFRAFHCRARAVVLLGNFVQHNL